MTHTVSEQVVAAVCSGMEGSVLDCMKKEKDLNVLSTYGPSSRRWNGLSKNCIGVS